MRMSGLTVAFAAIVGVFLATPTATYAADLKVGYVDMNKALYTVKEGAQAKARLKKEFDAKQKSLDDAQAKLKKKQEQFEKQKGMMKEETRNQKMEELQRELYELGQTYQRMQRELLDAENKAFGAITERLHTIVTKIGDRDSYQVILNLDDGVLYYKRHRDITDEVIKEYDQQYSK